MEAGETKSRPYGALQDTGKIPPSFKKQRKRPKEQRDGASILKA